MKKVLEIIGSLKIGGQEKVGKEIGLHIDRDKYEIHYLVFDENKEAYEQELADAGIQVFHLPEPSRGYIQYLKNLYKLMKENSYDIVHAHTMFNSGWAMLAGWQQRVPVRISHSHSIRGPEHRGFVKNLYEKTMRMMIRLFATDYVACGKGAGKWLYGEKFFEKNGTVIYNGIGLDQYIYDENERNKVREKYGLQKKFIIGHAGHFAPVKNQAFLLELMPEIIRRRSDAFLMLLGDGQIRKKLEEKIIKLGLQDRVLMTGNVKNVGAYMSAMDVFAFPSLYEGMPLALVEAQSNGLPCIISAKIPEDVYLTDLIRSLPLENSTEQWIEAIIKARRNHPERYRKVMGEEGFDIHGMLDRVYGLYERVK